MVPARPLARSPEKREVLQDFEMNSFERARESCPEERINDDVLVVRSPDNLLPARYCFALSEGKGRRLCLRPSLEAGEPTHNLEIQKRSPPGLAHSAEEDDLDARA